MKQLLKKPSFLSSKKFIVKPCSSDSIGCSYHVELFGKPCPGCTHLDLKTLQPLLPKSSPSDPIKKA